MANDILVVAVHPDDETLGCGGTLLKHKANGDRIHWVIVTEPISELFSAERITKRESEITQVAEKYQFTSTTRLGFPTTRLSQIPETDLIGAFSKAFNTIKPHTVYLPFCGDIHSDHRCSFDAAITCSKAFRYPFVKKVYAMEVLSETEFAPVVGSTTFIPNVFRDITQFIEQKCEILNLFEGEIHPAPFPRSVKTVEGLASFRGAVAGCMYAESFMLIKDVE